MKFLNLYSIFFSLFAGVLPAISQVLPNGQTEPAAIRLVAAHEPEIEIFDGDISLVWMANKQFLEFLKRNDTKVVFIDTLIGASVSIEPQYMFHEACGVDIESDSSALGGYIYRRDIGLPVPLDGAQFTGTYDDYDAIHSIESDQINCASNLLRIESSKERATTTHGGTGIVNIVFNGFFGVRVRSVGAITYFDLSELKADTGLRSRLAK